MKRFKKYIAERAVSPQLWAAMGNPKGVKILDFSKGITRFHRALLPGEDPKLAGHASIDIFKLMKKQGYRQLTGPGDDILVFTKKEELRHRDNTREFITVSIVKDPVTGWSIHKKREDAVRESFEGTEEYDLLCESLASFVKGYLVGYDLKKAAKIISSTHNLYKAKDIKKFKKMTNSLQRNKLWAEPYQKLLSYIEAGAK